MLTNFKVGCDSFPAADTSKFTAPIQAHTHACNQLDLTPELVVLTSLFTSHSELYSFILIAFTHRSLQSLQTQ